MVQESKIKRSEVRLAPVFRKPLVKGWLVVKKYSGSLFESRVIPAFVSFYTFSLRFLRAHFKVPRLKDEKKNWLDLGMHNFMRNLLEKKKKEIIKKIKYCRSSPDPENSRCEHQQSLNFFSVFVDFRTFLNASRKPKVVRWKQKN